VCWSCFFPSGLFLKDGGSRNNGFTDIINTRRCRGRNGNSNRNPTRNKTQGKIGLTNRDDEENNDKDLAKDKGN